MIRSGPRLLGFGVGVGEDPSHQFCDFRPKVCFSASGSKRFEILSFSSSSLTPFIFLR
ncbi:hypothetical protein Hanom_Chr06g00562551 [Helianthus anomalus]